MPVLLCALGGGGGGGLKFFFPSVCGKSKLEVGDLTAVYVWLKTKPNVMQAWHPSHSVSSRSQKSETRMNASVVTNSRSRLAATRPTDPPKSAAIIMDLDLHAVTEVCSTVAAVVVLVSGWRCCCGCALQSSSAVHLSLVAEQPAAYDVNIH